MSKAQESVVTFEPKPINALRVTVRDPQGALAQAGFRPGDLIIGIEGVEFTDEMHMQELLLGAMSKGPVKALVLRDGGRLEIPMDIKKMFGKDGNGGGEFEPAGR